MNIQELKETINLICLLQDKLQDLQDEGEDFKGEQRDLDNIYDRVASIYYEQEEGDE